MNKPKKASFKTSLVRNSEQPIPKVNVRHSKKECDKVGSRKTTTTTIDKSNASLIKRVNNEVDSVPSMSEKCVLKDTSHNECEHIDFGVAQCNSTEVLRKKMEKLQNLKPYRSKIKVDEDDKDDVELNKRVS